MQNSEDILAKWLTGELSKEQTADLKSQFELEELESLLNMQKAAELKTNPPEVIWKGIQSEIKSPSTTSQKLEKQKLGNNNLFWAILFALAILGALLLYKVWDNTSRIDTGKGQIEHVEMADNTEIQLSPRSQISYRKDYEKNRIIELTGQAYFDVKTKGAFKVITDGATIEVLGTQFDVWAISDKMVVVYCFEGEVKVSENQNSQTLAAGEGITINNGLFSTVTKRTDRKPLWLAGEKKYEGIALSSVYKDLERFYNITFEGDLSDEIFRGNLDLKDLEKTINFLRVTSGKKYTIQGKSVIVEE